MKQLDGITRMNCGEVHTRLLRPYYKESWGLKWREVKRDWIIKYLQ